MRPKELVKRLQRGERWVSKNEYGLDHKYFNKKLTRMLREIDRYTPGEFARECREMANTAKLETDRPATIDDAVEYAAKNLPEGCIVSIHVEKDGYDVELEVKYALVAAQVISIDQDSILNSIMEATDSAKDYV